MVNASLNWASIIGIVLTAFGGYLFYLLRCKPSIARGFDYTVLSIIAFLCGGILFFQGWRLDPILQFSQVLLTGATIWVTYENIKLRKLEVKKNGAQEEFEPISRKLNLFSQENKISENSNGYDRNGRSIKCSYCGAKVDI